MCDINRGVSQGSVLGPTLYILCIYYFTKASDVLVSVLFTDDTTLFYSGKNIQEVMEVVNVSLKKIKQWFDQNKFVLSVNKTTFILFNGKRKNIDISIKIDGMEIQRVQETKFLGVIISEDLSWKSHINYTKGKIAKSISVLHKVKLLFNHSALLILYNSLIIQYLTYCVEISGTTCKTYAQPLFILQQRALKTINNCRHRDSSNPSFNVFYTLSLTNKLIN